MDIQTAVTKIRVACARRDLPHLAWELQQLSAVCRNRFGTKHTPVKVCVREGSVSVIVYRYCPGNKYVPGKGTIRFPAQIYAFNAADCMHTDHEARGDVIVRDLGWNTAAECLTARLRSIS